MHPKYLINTGPVLAYLEPNLGDRSAYTEGFLEAAHHLASQLLKGEVPPDIIIYGALYLYRHGLELGFKALLSTYHYEMENDDKAFTGHNIEKLWELLKPQMDTIDHTWAEDREYFEAEAIEYIDECVKVIHAMDPDGQSIRYTEDTKGKWNLLNVKCINLAVLEEMCEGTKTWMHHVLNHRHFVDNFCRHQRGYFNQPA
jgi:hypothetical protein